MKQRWIDSQMALGPLYPVLKRFKKKASSRFGRFSTFFWNTPLVILTKPMFCMFASQRATVSLQHCILCSPFVMQGYYKTLCLLNYVEKAWSPICRARTSSANPFRRMLNRFTNLLSSRKAIYWLLSWTTMTLPDHDAAQPSSIELFIQIHKIFAGDSKRSNLIVTWSL